MSETQRHSAQTIAEDLLEITGRAIMTRDFDSFRSSFHLPQNIQTMGQSIYVETAEDLRRAFDQMCNHLEAIGVTDLVRFVAAAAYQSPDRITSTHVADLLRDGKRLQDPYPAFSVLERFDDAWKITSCEYALEPMSGQALAIARGDATHRGPSAEANGEQP